MNKFIIIFLIVSFSLDYIFYIEYLIVVYIVKCLKKHKELLDKVLLNNL